METIYKGIPTVFNGDRVISTMRSETARAYGWADSASMASWYREDPTKNYIGMVDLFTNFAQIKLPVMQEALKAKAVMEVNGINGSFTYDVPVYTPTGTWTMVDTSQEHEAPGIDESTFTIGLSKAYQPGDVLTYDKQHGQQIVVSEDYEVEAADGYFLHTVQLVTEDKRESFDKSKLVEGIHYFKVGHGLGEFSTQFSNLESPDDVATMRCEFVLGQHRGVETFYTMYANSKSISGAGTSTKEYLNRFIAQQEEFKDADGRPYDLMVMASVNSATQKIIPGTERIGSVLEYLVILENLKLEANQFLFQRPGIIKSINGTKRFNEGVYHQVRRGKRIEIARPGGITRDHLRQVSAYLFQGRQDMKPTDRRMKLKVGMGAWQNITEIFREEFSNQLHNLSFYMGNDRMIPNPVSGTLDALKLAPVTISEVYVADIGVIELEYDPSMNYELGADRFSRGMVGQGYAKSSYSAMIYDAGSSEYSNARSNMPTGAKLVEGGSNKANIYYVKPEGESMWWGYEQGRWSPNKASDIMSSSKTMSREFWVHSVSAGWVKDTTRYVIIELKR